MTINGEKRRQIYLAVKEALHNTIKHADCTTVIVSFAIAKLELLISIQDDGKGLCYTGERSGDGIGNMKMRMKKIGGSFDAACREGTVIRLIIPLHEKHENSSNSRR
ncbi:hypothetical protein EXU57_08040 [Segetibacter sp. 3557_3]|uniref:sensor histidine kinase n=1 Tax=Segetibacter sp. 3557_3 TaxID=2547429 RepID=UPI001058503A|nr:ATP-binding protein [Segetibacter sp. 3557_3]TDH26758.1 hypothetical protein EXU57_08040 [Segetibacter sp. 3557_3]